MATVFRAHDERLGRTVALKVLAPAFVADREFRARFIRESRATAITDHPHIIPVFEAGEAQGVLYIAMRFVPGGDLRQQLSKLGRLAPDVVVNIVSQAASALDAAHWRGVVHRDVKPGNLLLDVGDDAATPEHVYLSDFGLSRNSIAVGLTRLTVAGQVIGTLDYMAPEQIDGRPVDGRADQYGLACTAYELLCGTPPFGDCSDQVLMRVHRSTAPPPITSRRHDLPAGADVVFGRALAKSPNARYHSCGEFADALREVIGGASGRPGRPGPGAPPVAAPYPSAAATIIRPGPRTGRGARGESAKAASAKAPAAPLPDVAGEQTSSIYTQQTEARELA